jgi:hypothetical protein
MQPTRLLYYFCFVIIEAAAVLAAIIGVVLFFVPFVALKAAYVLLASRFGRMKGAAPPPA